MNIACLDLEGVLVPEIWINVAIKTGIEELKATTRDIPDYNVLMNQRLELLKKYNLSLTDIQKVIDEMEPLEGAKEFLKWLKKRYQVIILSDTFYQFATPLMKKLDNPTLFCHNLEVNSDNFITDYVLRMNDQKRESVKAFHSLNFKVIAAGDSYNDTSMLKEADKGIFFRAPENVIKEFSMFPTTNSYEELKKEFLDFN